MEATKIHGRSHHVYVKGRLEAAGSKRSIAEGFSVNESTEKEAEDRDSTDFCWSLQSYVSI
jgi:hypothetical protein